MSSFVLEDYQKKVDASLSVFVNTLSQEGVLKEACAYALLNGGKRFRAIIAVLMAEILNKKACVMDAAISLECFHAASLVADDLPCMDDENERRGRPCLHEAFGEGVAILTTYSLISLGFELILSSEKTLNIKPPDILRRVIISLETAAVGMGMRGASGGQFLDLFETRFSLGLFREMISSKTAVFFEGAFVVGFCLGGGNLKKLPLIRAAALHFGQAFQVADDFFDRERDALQKKPNILNLFGRDQAEKMFHEEKEDFSKKLKEAGIDSAPFLDILNAIFPNPQWVSADSNSLRDIFDSAGGGCFCRFFLA